MTQWKEPIGLAIVLMILLGVVVADAVVDRRSGRTTSYDQANLVLADFYEQCGAPNSSVVIVEEVSARGRRPSRLEIRRAALLVRTGRLAEAAEIYTDLLMRSPTSPVVEFNLAMVLHRLGRSAEAKEILRDFVANYGELLPEHTAKARHALHLIESAATATHPE
jgi:Flp pilus assembly protein TadD